MNDEYYMKRAIYLAGLGKGCVWSNPLVGAVLVYNNSIIGEGYHASYGQAHAEVNCLNNVKPENRPLIQASTMYVTLEPCSHYGKTPPCADRLIQEKVQHVVIGSLDYSKKVNGSGVAKLKAAGIKVTTGILENECRQLNKHFMHFHQHGLPYVSLKWAQTADGFIAPHKTGNFAISGELTKRFVHRLRAAHMGIMVGYRTAILDNPSLSLRYAKGLSPIRIVLDDELTLPETLKLFDNSHKTIVLHNHTVRPKNQSNSSLTYLPCTNSSDKIGGILQQLAKEGIISLLVEGGNALLQSFIDSGFYNEAIVITAKGKHLSAGLKAPQLLDGSLQNSVLIENDIIEVYKHNGNIDL